MLKLGIIGDPSLTNSAAVIDALHDAISKLGGAEEILIVHGGANGPAKIISEYVDNELAPKYIFNQIIYKPAFAVRLPMVDVTGVQPIDIYGAPVYLRKRLFDGDADAIKRLERNHPSMFALRNSQIIENSDVTLIFVPKSGVTSSETALPLALMDTVKQYYDFLLIEI